jgi:hypothetical protein
MHRQPDGNIFGDRTKRAYISIVNGSALLNIRMPSQRRLKYQYVLK